MIPADAREWLASGRNLILCGGVLACMAIALLPGAAAFFGIRGLRILKRKSIPYLHKTRFYFYRINRATARASQIVAKPIIVTAGASARMKTYWQQFTSNFKQQE